MTKFGTMSASKLSFLNGCAYAYKLKYLDHIKVPQNVKLAFGTEIHRMLEEFYKKNFVSSETFAKAWKFRWYLIGVNEEDNHILEEKHRKYHEGIKKRYGNISVYNENSRVYILNWYKKLGTN